MIYYELNAEDNRYFSFKLRPVETTPPHFHSAVEFIFVKEGTLTAVLDGEKKTLTSGNACFCDSFCVHSYQPDDYCNAYALIGASSFFKRYFKQFDATTPPKFFNFEDFTLLKTLSDLCYVQAENTKNRQAVAEGVSAILIGNLFSKTPFVPQKENKRTLLVCDILSYAEKNFKDNLSLQTLAQRFGYSREHLSRILNDYLCQPWHQYVNRLRIRHAHTLLQEENPSTVTAILNECGFESPNTFYRAYKKEYGKAPKMNI